MDRNGWSPISRVSSSERESLVLLSCVLVLSTGTQVITETYSQCQEHGMARNELSVTSPSNPRPRETRSWEGRHAGPCAPSSESRDLRTGLISSNVCIHSFR